MLVLWGGAMSSYTAIQIVLQQREVGKLKDEVWLFAHRFFVN